MAVALIAWLTAVFGRRATRWLLHPICWYFAASSPGARRASSAFLRRSLGREPGLADVLRHFHTFAATVHDRVPLVLQRGGKFEIAAHGIAVLERVLRSGRGCILLGSHMGSFEVLRAMGRVAGVHAVNIVMHTRETAHTSHALAKMAPELQERVIAPGRPETMLRIKECLEKGEIVGILGDRRFGGTKTRACTFLGAPAEFPLGPLLIAGTLGAPVVTFFGLYEGGSRYQIFLETLTEGTAEAKADRTAMAAEWLETYVERLERYARRYPYNWYNFYDFWNEGLG